MKITWNGTGSAWSTHWGNSSAVVESGGKRLLIDCGHTVPARLQAMGLSLRDLDAVFISHLHGDHVYGLEEWGFRNMLQWKIRPTLFIAATLPELLWDNVLSGTMRQVCDCACALNDYFDVVPLHVGQPHRWENLSLELHPVRHVPHARSYGVKVAEGKSVVGFTCDSLADAPNDPWFYEDTACVFHDCSFKPPFPGTVHAHFAQLCQYPAHFRERTYLAHYDDDIREKREQADWQQQLAVSAMRLALPYEPITV